jgi:hypothetical protein
MALPAGTVDWDDIVLKQVAPQPTDSKPKERRPSLETKVRTKDRPKKQRYWAVEADQRDSCVIAALHS